MTKEEVIKAREVLNKIKVKMSDDKEHAVFMIVRIDDGYVNEAYQAIFWDDDNGLMYYYSYNQLKGNSPYMIGRDKITVPAMISLVSYDYISSINMKLTKDALESSFKALEEAGVKYRNNDGELNTLDDKKKDALRKYFLELTDPARDPNFRITTEYPYK